MKDFSRRIAGLSQKRLVLLATELRSRLDKLERKAQEPIAVIGVGCRFPGGGNDPETFWQLLHNGVDAISEIPSQRWDVDAYYSNDVHAPGKIFTRWTGLMDRVDQFDAPFFGIAPREALTMDPQQRVLLETAWEALEHACVCPEQLVGSQTGVFIGISGSDYSHLSLSGGESKIDAYFASGNAHSVASGRLSYVLGLQGPCLSVDTACSSSLVAVHLAVQSLRNRECHTALAGGVNMILSPEITIALSKAEMMASDGRCKAFDARADGFVRGEGCGVLVLKRLSDAVQDMDHVLALIKGSAINQDGKSNGLTAPNGPSQEAVIRQALENGNVRAEEIGYVEAHGTGTSLGDPIEARALGAVFGQNRSKEDPLWVGAVKTNIGHLESAAGIAGLIKIILALQNEKIPPNLHFDALNPNIDWDDLPISVPIQAIKWPSGGKPRMAGVSSFGFSGTNAHVVLEGAPDVTVESASLDRPLHILTLSARSTSALGAQARQYADFLASAPDSPEDIFFSANIGRKQFKHRLAVIADSSEQARQHLEAYAEGSPANEIRWGQSRKKRGAELAFLFTGQGAQYVGMGKSLYQTQSAFRRTIDQCDEWLKPLIGKSLLAVLNYSNEDPAGKITVLDQTQYTQPILFSLEYALAELWRSWGVEPTVVMGHSLGEYVAACVAGVFTLQDGLNLVTERARMMQALPESGAMLAVFAETQSVEKMLEPYRDRLSIAAYNGPANTVVSGMDSDISALGDQLNASGVRYTRLKVSHGFHSALMETMLDGFEKAVSETSFSPPKIGVVSNLTGTLVGFEELSDPTYWRRHTRQAVRFEDSIRTLREQLNCELFIEVGPNPVLTGMAGQILPSDSILWLPSLLKGQDDWQRMLQSLADLHIYGYDVDWTGFDQDWPRRKVVLPTYPFERKQYWAGPGTAPSTAPAQSHDEDCRDWLYDYEWEPIPDRDSRALSRDQRLRPERIAKPSCWLVLADDGGTGQKLAEVIRSYGQSCILAVKGQSFEIVGKNHFTIDPHRAEDYKRLIDAAFGPDRPTYFGVVHLWALNNSFSLNDTSEDIEQAHQHTCGSALFLVQAMAECNAVSPPRLVIVTRGAQSIRTPLQSTGLSQTALWGLGKVIALEHPEFHCVCADLDYEPSDSEMEGLYDRVLSDIPEERQVAFRHGEYFGLRLDRSDARLLTSDRQLPTLPIDGVYLVTGGLAGLGLLLAQRLVERGARHLILMSRSGASESAKEPIRKMQKAGAEILAVKGDVADVGNLENILTRFSKDERRLRGIFHCAGTIDDGILIKQNWDRFRKVMAAKIIGSWNLHVLTQHISLDYFVLFSSGAAMFGSTGQGNYAAANAFLDGLAHYRRSQGLSALSINWGAWSKVGMASRGSVVERLETQGMGSIDPDQGLRILEHLMQTEIPQVGVLPIHWSELIKALPNLHDSKFLERFHSELQIDEKVEQAESSVSPLLQQVSQMPQEKRREFLLSNVLNQAAKTLGLDRNETIDIEQPLAELGLDSLMAVELRNSLSLWFGDDLPATLLFYYPSLQELVGYLESKALPFIEDETTGEITAIKNNVEIDSAKARVNDLDKFSESEMAKMLAEKLTAF